MKLIIDAMGGDNAPVEILRGVELAARDYPDAEFILTGRKDTIEGVAAKEGIKLGNAVIVDCPEVISMEDLPRSVVSGKKESSMGVGLRMLAAGEGDAFISAGNTGALMTGATLLVRCVDGIRHAAIATVLPMETPLLLIDSGSNVNVTTEMLLQFGILGSVYMEKLFGTSSPRVGLLNNGAEEHKGTKVTVDAYALMAASDKINFVGNVEGKGVPFSECDVLVTDGFTGNILLKSIEGVSVFILKKLKKVYKKNPVNMLSALLIKKDIGRLKKEFDASEYGGAPFLGISKPVIKAHGGSDAAAIRSAVRQAVNYVGCGVSELISQRIDTENGG